MSCAGQKRSASHRLYSHFHKMGMVGLVQNIIVLFFFLPCQAEYKACENGTTNTADKLWEVTRKDGFPLSIKLHLKSKKKQNTKTKLLTVGKKKYILEQTDLCFHPRSAVQCGQKRFGSGKTFFFSWRKSDKYGNKDFFLMKSSCNNQNCIYLFSPIRFLVAFTIGLILAKSLLDPSVRVREHQPSIIDSCFLAKYVWCTLIFCYAARVPVVGML